MQIFLSTEPVTKVVKFLENDKQETKWLWESEMVLIHRPSLISKTRTLLSSEQLTIYFPDVCKLTPRTQLS